MKVKIRVTGLPKSGKSAIVQFIGGALLERFGIRVKVDVPSFRSPERQEQILDALSKDDFEIEIVEETLNRSAAKIENFSTIYGSK